MSEDSKNKKLFRVESLERIQSPDQLEDYIRVSNPGVWIVLAAIVLLLVAGVVWASVGRLVEATPTVLVVKNAQATCYVGEDAAASVARGDTVRAGKAQGEVTEVAQVPLSPDALSATLDAYAAHRVGATGWMYPVSVNIQLADGVYDAHIATSSFAPIKLLFGGTS